MGQARRKLGERGPETLFFRDHERACGLCV